MSNPSRIGWIDAAKGLSIILVVQMHSTLGLEAALGATTSAGAFVDFASTFRMPLFFIVAGLFLSRSIDEDWRGFADKKVLHFAYFYVLWLTIQFAFKAGHLSGGDPVELGRLYVLAFVEPFGTLWFIYLLAVFFVVSKLLKDVNPWIVWGGAAVLSVLPVHTGSVLIDEFANRYVFFLTGFLGAGLVFRWSDICAEMPVIGVAALCGFVAANFAFFWFDLHGAPGFGLVLGLAGGFCLVGAMSVLTQWGWAGVLQLFGAKSLAIYLAFFLPMVISRAVLVKIHEFVPLDANAMALIITLAGITVPLIMLLVARAVGAGFLFERPEWAKLSWAASVKRTEAAAS